jgi:hypothetical protein
MRGIVSLVVAALSPAVCVAADPGQYVVNTGKGEHEGICLQADGGWYSTTYGGWSGVWKDQGGHTYLEGNWNSGEGNSAMVFNQYAGTWLEWTDGFEWVYDWAGATAKFVGTTCDAQAANGARQGAPGL